MKKTLRARLCCGFLVACSFIPLVNLSAVQVVTQPISSGGILNSGSQTKVVTVGHTAYTAWIEGDFPNAVLKAGMVKLDGSVESITLRTGIMNDQWHVQPSVAVDKDGYIHVTADMHYHDWVYYISDNPYDVSSFTQYVTGIDARCPLGTKITYPEFFTDANGELYLAFRGLVSDTPPYPYGSDPGNIGGFLVRYHADTQTWSWVGGVNASGYPSNAGDERPSLFWHASGSLGGWYQQPKIRLFFDSSNRMHAVSTISVTPVERTWNGASHLLYAYSDDGGQTFYKADGTLITSLPLTIHNATIIEDRSVDADLETSARVGAFGPGVPVVSYKYGGNRVSKKWDSATSSWVDVLPPNVASGIYTRRNGEAVFFRPYVGLYRTVDGGQTFETISHGLSYGANSESVDMNYYSDTGHFRYQVLDNATNEVSLYTIYSGAENPYAISALSGGSTPQNQNAYNLTAMGSLDWILFGWSSSIYQTRKAGANVIGDYQVIGTPTVNTKSYSSSSSYPWDKFTWSDGDNPVSRSNKTRALNASKVLGGGLEIDVPADLQPRRVTIWTSGWESDGGFTASLSDASQADYTSTASPHNAHVNFHMTKHVIDYNAASDGEVLTLSITADAFHDGKLGNVKLNAIALEDL